MPIIKIPEETKSDNNQEDNQAENSEKQNNAIDAKQLLLKSRIFREKSVNSPDKLMKMQGKRIFKGEEKTIQEIYDAIIPQYSSLEI